MDEPTLRTDAEALLAHAGWARRIAGHLVRDPDRADDAVQEAWLAALRRPPGRGRDPAGWLARRVRDAIRSARRGEARRARRDAAAARAEALPSTAELVQQAELQRELVAAVLTLEEPYRSTLLLRYWQDRSPQEIARQQGVPGGTVRSRLKRGLEQLRRLLDDRFGGDRRAWVSLLLPLSSAPQGAATALRTSTLGALAMTLQTKLALAVLLSALTAVGWLAWRDPSPSALEQPTSPVAVGDDEIESLGDDAAEATVEAGADASVSTREVATPGITATYHGLVRGPDGRHIVGATLALYLSEPGWRDREPIATGASDAEGRFRVVAPIDRGREILIYAQALGYAPRTEGEFVPERAIELVLEPVAEVFGVVTDAETGLPLAGASVATRLEKTTCDAAGAYRLRGIVADRDVDLFASAPDHAEETRELDLRGCSEMRLDFALSRGLEVPLQVVDGETGAPVVGAELLHRRGSREAFARTDEGGHAVVRAIEGGELQLEVRAEGYSPFRWTWEVAGATEVAPRIALLRWAWIEGTVLGSDGASLQALVQPEHERRAAGGRQLTSEERLAQGLPGQCWHDGGRGRTKGDEQGRFAL